MGFTLFLVIRHDGTFDVGGLYQSLMSWFERYRFMVEEQVHKHKVPGDAKGAEQEVRWIATLDTTEFVRFIYQIDFHIYDLVEFESEGKLVSNCKIDIKIYFDLVYDWQGKFKKGRLNQVFGKMYKAIFWKELGDYEDVILARAWDMAAHIRKYLGMETKHHQFAGLLGQNR